MNIYQIELQPREYTDPGELFFNEAFDVRNNIFNHEEGQYCAANGRPPR